LQYMLARTHGVFEPTKNAFEERAKRGLPKVCV
jgi:hypothetical protein